MSKIKFTPNAKLSNASAEFAKTESVQPAQPVIPDKILKTQAKKKITSFALKRIDLERIEEILKRTQPNISRKLNSTDILRGAIKIAEASDAMNLSEKIKETFSE